MGRSRSQHQVLSATQEQTLAELIELRERLRISDGEIARRMGISRQHLWAVLSGKFEPGPKVALGIIRLRERAREDARSLLALSG